MATKNQKRIKRMRKAVEMYRDAVGDDFALMGTVVTDMLTDLQHYCARYGIDFDEKLETSRQHYAVEK